MDKTIQDLAWSVLPKEFKEEVKKMYATPYKYFESNYSGACAAFNMLFGIHNLTSDAEGEEEMLYVSRKRVQEFYSKCEEVIKNPYSYPDYAQESALSRKALLDILFGSKCLPDEVTVAENATTTEQKPFKYSIGQKVILHFYGGEVSTITEAFNDGGVWNKYKVKMLPTRVWNENELDPYEEPKPSEPKFKVGDKVRFKYCCTTYRIDGFKMSDGVMLYQVGEVWAEESDLEPYTGPEENIAETRNFSQDCDKQFDNILRKSLSKERRLTIAAQMMQGLICAPLIPGVDPNPPAEYLAQAAFRLADALIAESEKRIK